MHISLNLVGKIRIVKVPAGEAPMAIRKKWIGIEIPCLFYVPHAFGSGVLSKKASSQGPMYVVLQTQAVEALARVHPETLVYWARIGYPRSQRAVWLFDATSVVVIQKVLSYARITGEIN